MKKILLIIALFFVVFSGISQSVIKTTIPEGKYCFWTLGSNSWVRAFDTDVPISLTYIPDIVDTVLTSTDTFTRPVGLTAAVTFTPSSTTSSYTITNDSLYLNRSEGNGSNPVIDTLDWDTLSYPNINVSFITVNYYKYSNSEYLPSYDYLISSVAEINALSLVDGDTVGINADSELVGTITQDVDGVTYGTYGIGEKATFKGSTAQTGWTNTSGNIWETSLDTTPQMVFNGTTRLELTASSNLDSVTWFTVTSTVNGYTFISTDLIGTDWSGAYSNMKLTAYSLDALLIVSCNSTTGEVVLDRTPDYGTLNAGKEFFVTNHISLLEAGEWMYDESDSTLYVYSTSEPTDIEASTIDCAFSAHNIDNITFSNLDFQRYNHRAIDIYADATAGFSDSILVDNCDFTDNFDVSVNLGYRTDDVTVAYTMGVSNGSITNCTVSGSNRAGLQIHSGTDSIAVISDNVVSDVGLFVNVGLNGFGIRSISAVGINTLCNNTTISGNTVSDIGYDGIKFLGTNNLVENNTITRCDLSLHDGGGIYTQIKDTIRGSIIRNNIVSNIGSEDGGQDFGIYLDGGTSGVTVQDNVVFGCVNVNSTGLFVSHGKNNITTGNTLYNNEAQFSTRYYASLESSVTFENNTITDNVFYSVIPTQLTATFQLYDETWDSDKITTISGNEYYNPQREASILPNDYFTYDWFQTYSGETGSTGFDTLISNYSNIELLTSSYITDSTFNSNANGWGGNVMVWKDTTLLDDGCMETTLPAGEVSYLNSSSILPTVSEATLFRLNYDIVSDGTNVYGSVGADGNKIGYFSVNDTRKHYSHVVEMNNETAAFLQFLFYAVEGTKVYIDNVTYNKVDADYTEPTDLSVLKLAGTHDMTGYYGLDGVAVTDTTVTQAAIFIKE